MDGNASVALADLARAFPHREIGIETLRVYLRELEDLPVPLVEEACRVLIRTSEFFPTVHSIRETVAERALALPGEVEALAQVNMRALWRDPETPRPDMHPLVGEALQGVGGIHAIRASQEASVLRGQFLRLYREHRRQAIDGIVSGDRPVPRPELAAVYPAT